MAYAQQVRTMLRDEESRVSVLMSAGANVNHPPLRVFSCMETLLCDATVNEVAYDVAVLDIAAMGKPSLNVRRRSSDQTDRSASQQGGIKEDGDSGNLVANEDG